MVAGFLFAAWAQPAAAAKTWPGLQGLVLGQAGQPLGDVCVSLLDATSNSSVASARSAADGSWSVARMPRASVKVRFKDCGGRGFVTRLHGASQILSVARVVSSGGRADTVMTKKPGFLSGTVANEAGQPVMTCMYIADAAAPNARVGAAITGPTGAWTLGGLMPDSYQVSYADCGGTNYRGQTSSGHRPGDMLTAVLEHSLKSWLNDRTQAATAPADVMFLGDSITEGYGVSTRAESWVDRVRSGLQTAPGGIGYLPAQGNEATEAPFDQLWVRTGGTFASKGMGRRSHVLAAEGDSATLAVTADRISVHYVAQPDGGLIDVLVDGQPAGQIDTGAASYDASARWDTGSLTIGTHVVELRAAPDGAGVYKPAVVQGAMVFAGDEASGVRVWENGHAGYTASHFATDSSWPTALKAVDPELIVISFGANDERYYTPAQFEGHLRQLVDVARANAPESTAIALVSMLRPSWVASATWSKYAAAQQRVAMNLGLAFTDIDKLATAAGESPDTLTIDGVHPNTGGYQFIATHVEALLTTGSSI
jgi:lysophospholipase L1-like esterase